jgi:hypothetical protein
MVLLNWTKAHARLWKLCIVSRSQHSSSHFIEFDCCTSSKNLNGGLHMKLQWKCYREKVHQENGIRISMKLSILIFSFFQIRLLNWKELKSTHGTWSFRVHIYLSFLNVTRVQGTTCKHHYCQVWHLILLFC